MAHFIRQLLIKKNKKFINILEDTHQIRLTLNNVLLPFGTEKYNDKNIINIELEKDNNIHNNYISMLDSIENKVKNFSQSETFFKILTCFWRKIFILSKL